MITFFRRSYCLLEPRVGPCTKKRSQINDQHFSNNGFDKSVSRWWIQFSFKTAGRQDVNVAGSESIRAPRNVYATRNDATYPEGAAQIQWGTDEWVYRGWQLHNKENRLEKSLQIKNIYLNWKLEVEWEANRLYLSPYHRFGMPVVWRIWTKYFPSTSPCVEAYSTP